MPQSDEGDVRAQPGPPGEQVIVPRAEGGGPPPPDDGERPTETVTADEAGDAGGDVEKLGAVRVAGLWLAAGVGFLILAVTLALLLNKPWLGVPNGLDSMDEKTAKSVVDNIKTLSDLSTDRTLKLFNSIVGQSLLPVFTSILGYIFGSRAASKNNG